MHQSHICKKKETTLKNVVIVARMPEKGISGGRYFALISAVALAEQGVNVLFWVDCFPKFFDEFSDCPGHGNVNFHIDPLFTNFPGVSPDLVIVFPHMLKWDKMYYSAILFAQKTISRLALINFESPDWFNSLSPVQKPEKLWGGWKLCARYADAIISISQEGERWARRYYEGVARKAFFSFLYPPINEYSLQKSRKSHTSQVEIVCITRFDTMSSHKGAKELSEAINDRWKGRILNIVCGHPPEGFAWQQILNATEKHGVEVKLHLRASESEKFELLHRASLLVFLTRFEGYGYPPVEAIWAGTEVLCSDLPVIREVTKDLARYVDLSRGANLGDEIEIALKQRGGGRPEIQKVMDATSLKAFSTNFDSIYEQLTKSGRPISASFKGLLSFKVREHIYAMYRLGMWAHSCPGKIKLIAYDW